LTTEWSNISRKRISKEIAPLLRGAVRRTEGYLAETGHPLSLQYETTSGSPLEGCQVVAGWNLPTIEWSNVYRKLIDKEIAPFLRGADLKIEVL